MLTDDERVRFVGQLATGMSYLHSKTVRPLNLPALRDSAMPCRERQLGVYERPVIVSEARGGAWEPFFQVFS